MMILGGGTFQRLLDHKDGAHMKEISALTKETLESTLITMWGHYRKAPSMD